MPSALSYLLTTTTDELPSGHGDVGHLHRVPHAADGVADVGATLVLEGKAHKAERCVPLVDEAAAVRGLLVPLEVDRVLFDLERATIDGELTVLSGAEDNKVSAMSGRHGERVQAFRHLVPESSEDEGPRRGGLWVNVGEPKVLKLTQINRRHVH
jgi:hypothetical protein